MATARAHEPRPVIAETPFDSIESAHEYVALLAVQVAAVKIGLADDLGEATGATARRRRDALRLVEYKLTQLEDHLGTAGRLLNDLRALRRLLLGERDGASGTGA